MVRSLSPSSCVLSLSASSTGAQMRKHTNHHSYPPPLLLPCAVSEPPSPQPHYARSPCFCSGPLPVVYSPHRHQRGLVKHKSDYVTHLLKMLLELPDAPLGPGPRDQAAACLSERISLIHHTAPTVASVVSPAIPSLFHLGALARTGHSSWNALSLDSFATGSFLPFRFRLKRHLLREAFHDYRNMK